MFQVRDAAGRIKLDMDDSRAPIDSPDEGHDSGLLSPHRNEELLRRFLYAQDSNMDRILLGMVAFGLLIGLLFPHLVSMWVEARPGEDLQFRLACLLAGLSVGCFSYGVARFTLYRANQRLVALANLDPLTGLANHRHFVDLLEGGLEQAARDGRELGLIFADLDQFKLVNDTEGHLVGKTQCWWRWAAYWRRVRAKTAWPSVSEARSSRSSCSDPPRTRFCGWPIDFGLPW
ncbi:MAG TPA: GGDEF domain-containing protein, partial [Thermoleophilia bacterium]|nr:GGDEF domain-containing protein [Thermoleophilia bacterium]